MPTEYKLVAAPHLLPAGDFQGHLETVTFIAANEKESHRGVTRVFRKPCSKWRKNLTSTL